MFAPNIEGAVFRRIIEFASGEYVDFCLDENIDDCISENKAKEMIIEYRNAFKFCFCNEWIKILDDLLNCSFTKYDSKNNEYYTDYSFITEEYAIDIINNSLNFSNINKPFNIFRKV